MTHPHLEGLIRTFRERAKFWHERGTEYGESASITFADCADELEAALATLVGTLPPLPEPVTVAELDRDDEFRYVKAYTAEQMREYAKAALAALPGGGVYGLEECHRHSCKRKAALRQPRLIGWRSADYTMETADQKVALNWQGNIDVLPIFEGDPNTKLPTPTPHEADRNDR